MPWWRGATIYQVYPRSFADGNGDGVGDLPGITAKLPYIASLGVDGVWLSPFFTSPMKDFGYDVSDYRGIAPLFGDMEDFDALIARDEAAMADPDLYARDPTAFDRLTRAIGKAREEKDAAELRWLDLAEQVEALG